MSVKTSHIIFYALTLVLIFHHFQYVIGAGNTQEKTTTSTSSPGPTTTKIEKPVSTNDCINGTGTNCTRDRELPFFNQMLKNKPMLLRALYVLLAVTSIVIVYFVVRSWRVRRRASKSRKYGLITAKGTDMEMAPLDQDDDDEDDMTLYEMNNRNSRRK